MGRVPVVDLDIISFGRGYYSQLIKQKVDMIQVCKIKTCEIQVCGITMTISTDYRVDSTDYHPIQRSHKKKKNIAQVLDWIVGSCWATISKYRPPRKAWHDP